MIKIINIDAAVHLSSIDEFKLLDLGREPLHSPSQMVILMSLDKWKLDGIRLDNTAYEKLIDSSIHSSIAWIGGGAVTKVVLFLPEFLEV